MRRLVFVLCLGAIVTLASAHSTPLTIHDLSLMLRSGYSSDAVLHELSERRLAENFDSTAEKQLVQIGATGSLLEALRSHAFELSAKEMDSFRATARANAAEVRANPIEATNSSADRQSVAPPQVHQIGGTMYDHLKDDLVYWHEGSLVPCDNETLEKKKFYLLFFSAIWSKEGRQFTPQLVDYYNRVRPQHPELEIVFFSADRSEFAMENYVSQTNMPWPIVDRDKLQGKAGALAGSFTHQIPRLILAEASGRLLSDSGEGQSNFDKVLAETDKVLASSK